MTISRRSFLVLTGAALATPAGIFAKDEVPAVLDHILLGCSDLDAGIAFVEQRTGIRATFGGVHPGRGTRNALLSLGERHYLEIIAPDPAQADATEPISLQLRKLTAPHLVGWAAHPGDLDAFAAKLKAAGEAFEGPRAGSRKRPDGRTLHWKTLTLADDRQGLLPFFIEWSADSLHPSADAPQGCRPLRFELATPDPEGLKNIAALLSLDAPITKGEKPQLRATIVGPKGELSVTS
jgi:catechol 2,3-dioxygenase-like lactoylglutathione lyase family enzyme